MVQMEVQCQEQAQRHTHLGSRLQLSSRTCTMETYMALLLSLPLLSVPLLLCLLLPMQLPRPWLRAGTTARPRSAPTDVCELQLNNCQNTPKVQLLDFMLPAQRGHTRINVKHVVVDCDSPEVPHIASNPKHLDSTPRCPADAPVSQRTPRQSQARHKPPHPQQQFNLIRTCIAWKRSKRKTTVTQKLH